MHHPVIIALEPLIEGDECLQIWPLGRGISTFWNASQGRPFILRSIEEIDPALGRKIPHMATWRRPTRSSSPRRSDRRTPKP